MPFSLRGGRSRQTAVGGRPPFGDGGHEAVAQPLVVPLRVVILRPPDDNALVMRNGLVPISLSGGDAKKTEVVAAGLENLSALEDVLSLADRQPPPHSP